MDDDAKKEVEDLAAQLGDKLTPAAVLNAAKQAGTALHAYFEQRGAFDPTKAMERYGLIIAREVIRSCKFIVRTETHTFKVPKFVRDPEAAKGEQGYVSVARLRTDEDMAREALVAEFARAGAVMARAQNLAAAFNLSDEIAAIREQWMGLSQRMHEAPAAAQ